MIVMDLIARHLPLSRLLAKKSFFLFGPRSTGKSTLISQQLATEALVIDLLDSATYLNLASDPSGLEALIAADHRLNKIIVIDEIQRLPELLNEVHRLIERDRLKFLLTGSSARQLRRAGVNWLAGRAWLAHLYPLTRVELGKRFILDRYLRYGGLPVVYLGDDPDEELNAYTGIYLREEVQAEGLARDLSSFSRFLRVMALANTEVINFTKLGNDCQVSPRLVSDYLQILQDTMLGMLLPAWTMSKKRKAIKTAKFYFFDVGVSRVLAGIETIDRHSNLYGKVFEHFIAMELRAYLSYRRKRLELSFWRSKHGHEVDFIVGGQLAIEVKACRSVTKRDLRSLSALADEKIFPNLYLVSHDKISAKYGTINCMPWSLFLDKLWNDELC